MDTKQSLALLLNHNTMPDTEDTFLPTRSRRRRSSSFSSLSTLSSDYSPLSPETILQTGVPFSWEKLPGIPKTQPQKIHRKNDLSSKVTSLLLPPPPPTARLNRLGHTHTDPNPRNKKTTAFRNSTVSKRDPFLAAYFECCRDDETHHHQGLKSLKTQPTFHKFNLFSPYAICKTSGPVSESIVYIPKSNTLF